MCMYIYIYIHGSGLETLEPKLCELKLRDLTSFIVFARLAV